MRCLSVPWHMAKLSSNPERILSLLLACKAVRERRLLTKLSCRDGRESYGAFVAASAQELLTSMHFVASTSM